MVSEIGTHGDYLVGKSQQPGLVRHLLAQLLPQEGELGEGFVQVCSKVGPQVFGEHLLVEVIEAAKKKL